jgi:hypothetical protein
MGQEVSMFKVHRGFSSISAGVVAAGLLIATPTRTMAQERFRYQRDYQRFEQLASNNGYREGFARGEEDARLRRDFSFARDDEYQRADVGFRVGDGDLRDYRRMFRQGFEAGYADGYDRSVRDGGAAIPRTPASRGPFGITGGTLTPAARIGFQDGYDVGRKDATDGETFDPVRSGRYRSADHEYDRKFGSREEFKAEYRGGFEEGYEQGYRSVR